MNIWIRVIGIAVFLVLAYTLVTGTFTRWDEENQEYLLNKNKIIEDRIRNTVKSCNVDRGLLTVAIQNDEVYYITDTRNNNYPKKDIASIISKGDSLIKSANSDRIILKKYNSKKDLWETFEFRHGRTIR